MSYDIYGMPLRQGYCEVHPYVEQAYPCPLCQQEAQQHQEADEFTSLRQMWQYEHDERIRLEERCKSLEAKAQAYKDMMEEYYKQLQAILEA